MATTAANSATRYRGADRRQQTAPDISGWRTLSGGIFCGVLLVALLLRVPDDAAAAARQVDLLVAATALLAAAAGAALLLRHTITSRTADLLSGLALICLAVGHLALVRIDDGPDGMPGAAVAATYTAGQIGAIALLLLRFTLPAVEPRARRIAATVTAGVVLTGAGFALSRRWHDELHGFSRPVLDGPVSLDLLFAALWAAVLALALRNTEHRPRLVSPPVLVVAGNLFAVLAPVIAVATGGDPGRARWTLTAGTALCGLIMSAEALQQVLRGQRDRLLESEIDRVAADQIRQAERAARSELDHDVASALLAVEGAARALERLDDGLIDQDHSALAAAMASEVGRLQHLIRGVRGGADKGTFSVGPALLPVITCDLAQGHDIRAEIPADLVARGSALATAQVLRNLLDNAYRHAPGSAVRIVAETRDDELFLRVKDDGPGVADADRARIFERGRQGEGHGDGTGLGLYVATRLMEDQGGQLVLEDGPGTTFCMRLPTAVVEVSRG